jgi:hypothetical protein
MTKTLVIKTDVVPRNVQWPQHYAKTQVGGR